MIQIIKHNEDVIKVIFPYNPEFVVKIKTISGRKWHPDEKFWSVPNNSETVNTIFKLFENKNLQIDPDLKLTQINYDFSDLKKELVSRKYSYKTLKSYVYYNRELIDFAGKSPSEITNEDIKNFLVYLTETKNAATATINQAINALKFYYRGILKKKFIYEIVRTKKDKKLPVILSKEEIAKIIN